MIHVVTGGSGSGKSAYAEEQIIKFGPGRRVYVATMHPYDDESFQRIKRHQDMRKDKGFETIECYTGLAGTSIQKDAQVLLECVSNLVANEMYEDNGAGEETVEAVLEGIQNLAKQAKNLVIVTNEIASDIQDYSKETRKYVEHLGRINVSLGKIADQVTEVVYGIPVKIK